MMKTAACLSLSLLTLALGCSKDEAKQPAPAAPPVAAKPAPAPTTPTPTPATPAPAPTPAPGASVTASTSAGWLAACAGDDKGMCEWVAVSPDKAKVALVASADDGLRGWYGGLEVVTFDVANHKPMKTDALSPPAEDHPHGKPVAVDGANKAAFDAAAAAFKDWTFERWVPAKTEGLPAPVPADKEEDDVYEASFKVDGKAVAVKLEERLACDEEPTKKLGLGFRTSMTKAYTVAQGSIAIVDLGGGRYGDMCGLLAPTYWVGALK